ncbi:hypothetical protein [Gordonia sp. NPDC003950]
MMSRVVAGTAIVAGALGVRPDLFLGWAVRTRRRWGVSVVVDQYGREWPVGDDGVELLEPNTFRLIVGVVDGVRYPAAVCGGLAQCVSVVAEMGVEPAVAVGGVPVGVWPISVDAAALRPVDGTEPRTGDIDVGNAAEPPLNPIERRPQFHAESSGELFSLSADADDAAYPLPGRTTR